MSPGAHHPETLFSQEEVMVMPKVLLVDDEGPFVQSLAERLAIRGVAADIVTDGHEALEYVTRHAPVVVVMDMVMPGIDGTEVLKQIKRISPRTQVILLTGRGSVEDGIEAMRHGAFDYLLKPVMVEDLLEKIHEAAQGSRSAPTQAAEK